MRMLTAFFFTVCSGAYLCHMADAGDGTTGNSEAIQEYSESDWPQFRGVSASGLSKSTTLPLTWSSKEHVEWAVDIPGRGWSSPVVLDDFVVLTTAVNTGDSEPARKGLYFGGERPTPTSEHEWKVYCLHLRSGQVHWERTVYKGTPVSPIHLKNSYASETPVVHAGRVYACFGNRGITCLDFDGNIIWQYAVEARPTRLGWGTSSSPVLHDGTLYYQFDNDERSTLTAIDADSGKVKWEVERDEKSNWSTPYVWVHKGRTEIVTAGTGAVRSYDSDGNELWSLRGMSSITIAVPYAADDLLYVSSGYILDQTKVIYAIRPGASGDISLASGDTSNEFIAWSNAFIAPYNPTTLVSRGRLYVLYDRGLLSCFDAKTGEQFYDREKLARGVAVTASPVAGAGKLYCLNEDGVCCVVEDGSEFRLLHVNSLADDDMCLATPAISGDRLLIRSDRRIYCIRQP